MKNRKKFKCRWLPETNKPVDTRFLPVFKHPIQAAIIDELTPSITVWDRVYLENGHAIDTRQKRQFFDSVQAESKQLKRYNINPGINSQTGVFPRSLSTPDTFFELTLTFLPQRLPTA